MAQQIKKKFLSPEVIEYFDDQIELVETSISNEVIRAEGEESRIEGKVDQEVLDRQAGDGALDTRITALEEQVGEDLQQAIENLQDAIDAEALARDNADIALDLRIDALEAFGYEQVVYVAKNGLDTNTGKQHSPFLTITAAQNAITDASPSKRYAIRVSPGAYTEASLALKANVYIVGEGQKEAVRITGAVSMGASFTQPSSFDNRSGFSNVVLLSACNFDWNAVQSPAGKLYFNQVIFASTVSLNGYNNAIAQAQFSQCQIFGTFTNSGVNVGVFQDNICFGSINLNQHPNGGMATLMSITGGHCNGNITLTTTVNDFNRRCAIFARDFWSENLRSDGPSSYADVDLTSGSKQGAVTANGGQVIPMNPVLSHDLTTQMIVPRNTNSHNMGDWGKQWTWNFGYVHASTGTDLYVISYPSSYSPDSEGKSVYVITDGAGLQDNVDGGSIVLETSATTGTGVRGIVKLDGRHIDASTKQIKNVAPGTDPNDAVNKQQLDLEFSSRPTFDPADYYTKTQIDVIESDLETLINAEKTRVDAILDAAEADKDSFAEIVQLINSVDTENDNALGAFVLSTNDALSAIDTRVDALEAKGFAKSSTVVGANLEYIDLDRQYSVILSMSVGRLAVHEGEDYTVSVVGGVTRVTWINSLAHPDGVEKIETGDKVFWSGSF